MTRLPVPGSDNGLWGDILNDFLNTAHTSTGGLKSSALASAGAVTSVNGKTPSGGVVSLTAADVGAPTALSGLTDVATSGASDAQVLAYSASAGKWQPAAPSGGGGGSTVVQAAHIVIAKNGSNAVATRTADATQLYSGADAGAALAAAITSLGAPGGVIAFQPGTYTWSSTPGLPPNLTGWLQILGNMATINLTTAGNRFLDFAKQADGDTFRYLRIDGFTIDASALSSWTGTQHIVLGTYRPSDGISTGTNVNFQYLTLSNIRTLSVRVASSATAHFLNIFIGIHQSASGLPENFAEHISMENIEMNGGNHGITIYGNKAGSWSGDPSIRFDDVTLRHIRHDLLTDPTAFDFTSHVHVSSLGYGDNILIDDVWGKGSRDVAVEVDAAMNPRISNVTAVNYMGFAVALTNYHAPSQYLAQHAYVHNALGIRTAGQTQASSSSVVGIRTSPGLPNGHFTLENIAHYRASTAPDLGTNPIAGDLVSLKGSAESLTLNGGHYEAVGAVLSGTSSQAAQIVYVDNLTSTRTRINISNLDVRFRGTKGVGATAGIALSAVQLNGDVDTDINNVRLYVDFPTIEQVTGIDLGGASGGVVRGKVETVKVYGPNLGSNAKGVFVPSSATVTIPYAGALRLRYIDPDALPAGADMFIGDTTNKALVDTGIMPLSANLRTVSANHTITAADGVIVATTAGITVSLPSGTNSGAGKQFTIKNTSAGIIFLNALGGTIDGGASVNLNTGVTQTYVSDGTNWILIYERANEALLKAARTVTTNYSIVHADAVIFADGSSVTVSLPSATNSGAGKQFIIKNLNAANAFVNSLGGNIEGTSQITLATNGSVVVISDGTNWWTVANV